MRDWGNLPIDLLIKISETLTITDLFCFSSVCSPWKAAFDERRRLRLPHAHTPWLTVTRACDFFSLAENMYYSIQHPTHTRIRCIGASHGWLVHHDGCQISIFNPVTRHQIQFPPLYSFCKMFERWNVNEESEFVEYPVDKDITSKRMHKLMMTGQLFRKAVLLSDPASGDEEATLFLLYNNCCRGCQYARSTDKSWTILHSLSERIYDLICHQGQIYTVSNIGFVSSWDFNDGIKSRLITWEIPPGIEPFYDFYLVSSPWGDLLRVERYEQVTKSSLVMEICKVDFGGRRLVEVESIGDHALFVGLNSSQCISTLGIPRLKRNCVYYTGARSWLRRKHVVGIYSLEDERRYPLLPKDPCFKSHRKLVWLFPTLY